MAKKKTLLHVSVETGNLPRHRAEKLMKQTAKALVKQFPKCKVLVTPLGTQVEVHTVKV